jgi:P4 family phage/plasmid primase-like protien
VDPKKPKAPGDPEALNSSSNANNLSTLASNNLEAARPLASRALLRGRNSAKARANRLAGCFRDWPNKIAITAFASLKDTKEGGDGDKHVVALAELASELASDAKEVIPKGEGNVFVHGTTSGGTTDEECRSVTMIFADGDGVGPADLLLAGLDAAGAGYVFQRRTHDRWHLHVPLVEPIENPDDKHSFTDAYAFTIGVLSELGGLACDLGSAPSCQTQLGLDATIAQRYLAICYPITRREKTDPAPETLWRDGKALDFAALLEAFDWSPEASNEQEPEADEDEAQLQARFNAILPLEVRIRRAGKYLSKLPASIEKQNGSGALWNAATGARKGFALPRDAALAALKVYNERAIPPWSDAEIDHKLDGAESSRLPWGYFLPSKEKLPAKASAPAAALYFDRGDGTELAQELLKKLGSDVVFDDGALWSYSPDDGVYGRVEREDAAAHIMSFAGGAVGENARPLRVDAHTCKGAIELACMQSTRKGFFAAAPVGVCFANGFARVVDGAIVLGPHARENRARHRHAFDYVPDLPHPLLDRFLLDVFEGAEDMADRIKLLQEFFGACLVGKATTYERCLVLHGQGGTGKSTTLSIIRANFPPYSVVSIPPHKWGERFQTAELVGALLNAVDEMPASEIVSGEAFKSVVTGNPQQAERKYQGAFNYNPRAGHIFNANRLPGTRDQTDAFWDRIMVLNFDQKFRGTDRQVRDAHLDVLEELPAIVAWGLEGAARLQTQKRYTEPASSVASWERWRAESNSVAQWFMNRCRLAQGKGTRARPAYQDYRLFCNDGGLTPVGEREFKERMKELGAPVRKTNEANVYPIEFVVAA